MTTLESLLDAFGTGKLKLPALFDALNERGRVSADQHAQDVAWLEQQRDAGTLDAEVVQAVLGKLVSLQPPVTGNAPAGSEATDDDVTRIQPPQPPAGEDVTRVQSSAPGAPAEDEDGTIVRPRGTTDNGDDSATVVRPTSEFGTTGSSQTSASSVNTSSWRRVAEETGGEYATVGMLLKGRFLLERELGRGGMGVVYLARDERKVEARDRDPYVAVKVLNDEFRRHPDSLIALQRESRRSQRLAHDNIVRVYDFDKEATIVFMTMEYIDGKNLKTLIREEAYDGMPLARARPLIEGMAHGLGRAHKAGVVHSDFKPGNVMVTTDGVAKVFDFGIARAGKFAGDASGEKTVFDAGTLGAMTPAYASLEMLRGEEPEPTDDIYALGCVAYELLTGKHPFGKASAEVALKEGRKPPHVPGLTRRQNATLVAAVALHREQRLKSVDELVEGLRDVSVRERARPFVIYGTIVVIALVAAAWGTHYYLQVRHLDQVIGRFALANPNRYANEDQAYKAVESLGAAKSKQAVVDHGSAIQTYLLSRLVAYWNPAQKHYNYAAVQHVAAIREKLKLYSPQLDVRFNAIKQQRNDLLNKLDTQFSQRVAVSAIFPGQPDNVLETLKAIRAINPHSPLLDSKELALNYDLAVGKSIDAGKLDQAQEQLAFARKMFPKSQRLQARVTQIGLLEQAQREAKAVAIASGIPQVREQLAGLIAKPSLTPTWQAAVAKAVKVLQGNQNPATQKLLQQLTSVIGEQAATARTPTEVLLASQLVALGMSYAPDAKSLLSQRDRLQAMIKQHQEALAKASAAAEVASRIESLKSAAAASDIDKAVESLARIRELQPDNPFLKTEGPQLVANAYLGKAHDLIDAGKYQNAVTVVDNGIKALGKRADLARTRTRLNFVVDLMKVRDEHPSRATVEHLRRQLDELKKADADGVTTLAKRLADHGALPRASFASLLDTLEPPRVAKAKPKPKPEPKAVVKAPVPKPTHKPQPAPAPAAKPESKPEVAAKSPPSDPCARSGLAGTGRVCFDHVGSARGPALVVIPDGSKPFALSRTEITVREFNRFCDATHQCKPASGEGSLPATNVSLAQAKAYAAWLTKTTGYTYRLPANAQWLHAAKAGSGWQQSPDSNCIPPSGSGGMGGPIPARGRQPNPWGLVNMTGNVWEWVTDGGHGMIRGGAYDSYWSACTVAAHRNDSGKPGPDIGFRVLRELR